MNPSPIQHAPSRGRVEQTPALICDICHWPMSINEVTREPDGTIHGILKCSQCVEDDLATSTLVARAEVGMVGGRS